MGHEQVSTETTDQDRAVTLTYVHNGEEKTIDLSDPVQVEKASKQLSKGAQFDISQKELGDLRKKQNDLDKLVEASKHDEEAWLAFKGMIEGLTGRKFENAQQVEDHFEDKPNKAIVALEKKLESLQNQLTQRDIFSELDALETEFKDEGFDREAVIAKAKETGVTDFRLIWSAISKDAAVERARQEMQSKTKNNREKRRLAATETEPGSPTEKAPARTFKNYREISDSLANDISSGKLTLFDGDETG